MVSMMSDDNLVKNLLRPINKKNPCGQWLRYDDKFLEISSEREEDDPGLPMGEWERPLKKANWKIITEKCSNLLVNHSKDLQLAVWMSEALINLKGMEGLLNSLKLFDGLVSSYWDNIWPKFDSLEPEARVAPFKWMNSKLIIILRKNVILLSSNTAREEAILFKDWELLNENKNTQDVGFSKESIRKSLCREDVVYLKELIRFSSESINKIDSIGEVLDKKLLKNSPSLLKIKEYLISISTVVESFIENIEKNNSSILNVKKNEAKISKKNHINAINESKEEKEELNFLNKTEIKDRNDAYQSLESIANYLETLEPHSPTPYLIRRAVRWGNMSLKELAEDIGKNDGSIQGLLSVVGLKDDKK